MDRVNVHDAAHCWADFHVSLMPIAEGSLVDHHAGGEGISKLAANYDINQVVGKHQSEPLLFKCKGCHEQFGCNDMIRRAHQEAMKDIEAQNGR